MSVLKAFVFVALVAVTGQFALAAPVVYDDFSGGSFDTSKWTLYEGETPVQAGGTVTLQQSIIETVPTGRFIRSTAAFGYGIYNVSFSSASGNAVIIGVNSNAETTASPDKFFAGDGIFVRNDSIGGINIFQNGTEVNNANHGLSGGPATYTFEWLPTSIRVLLNGTQLYQSTSPLEIPNEPLRFDLGAYGSGTLVIDSVSFEAVPEPSSVTLLLVSTLGLTRLMRKRRA